MRVRSALFAALSATLLTLLTNLPMPDSLSRLPAGGVSAHGEPQVPAPAECRVAPRPLADVAATAQDGGSASSVTGTTAANESTDAPPFIMPPGAPVDDLTWSAVVATVVEMLACENAGDRRRAYALQSDAFLQRQLGQLAAGSPDGAWLDTFSTPPAPRPEPARNALLSIEGMRVLPDGRVGALVHVNRTDDARPEERAFVTFTQANGRWLIDETVNEGPADEAVIARATLQDTAGTTMGTAEFTQSFGGLVTVAVTLDGAPPGGHALHLHAVGACDPEGDAPFASAGDHFNPAGAAHPEHAGDLGNMGTDTAGHGEFWTVADRFTLSPSPSSLLDGDGSALILTAGMDDQTSAPDGNSGPRIACGVLSLVDRDAPTDAGGLNLTMLALGGLIIGSGSLLALQGWRTRRRTRSRPQPVGVAQRPPSTQE